MADIDKELEKIEQGEAWDDSDKVVQVELKKPLDKVIPVRLPSETWELLRKEARELGIGPTTLARMWILERLRLQSISKQDPLSISQLTRPDGLRRYPKLKLTPMEYELIAQLTQGMTVEEIVGNLNMSEETVKESLASILETLKPENINTT